jgi:hypothetical protein
MDALAGAIAIAIFAVAAFALLYIVYSFIKHVAKFLLAVAINSLAGLIVLALLKMVGINVPLTLPIIISIALFGLGGVGTILVLLLFGVHLQ